jgi:predicted RNase H-like HicB family nuclease
MKYGVVIEKAQDSFGAYVPDLPGCVAVGDTLDEVEQLIREAVQFHIEGLKQDGLPLPPPVTVCEYVDAPL